MSYSTQHLRTAGKISVYATFIGISVFFLTFIFNLGLHQVNQVDAQANATTSVTVLNTPPVWTASTTETIESSNTNPTNAGDQVSWNAIGTDPNGEPYYLLICDTSAAPIANANSAPACSSGVQWGVSASTTSGTIATVATTTLDSWVNDNDWFGWICDGNATTPRCNTTYTQGTNATNTSPFEVNHRPQFTAFSNNSPTIPGGVVTFMSTSSDSDIFGGIQDKVMLYVCGTAAFSTTTGCVVPVASTTVFVSSNATATYTVIIPTQDQSYNAYGYVVDNHNFAASGGSQGTNSIFSISNVAPTITGASISLNGGTNMVLTQEASQTPAFTLQFITSDNNSCVNASATSEVVDYNLAVYRSGVGSTTCTAAGVYNVNNCYPSGVATSTWGLQCTPGACAGATSTVQTWDCTFPLWYVADATDGTSTSTQYWNEDWRAQVSAVDDNAASGVYTEGITGVDVTSFLGFALINTLMIQYGAIAPGSQTDPLAATTTLAATGNVGLANIVDASAMCSTFYPGNLCPNSASSTIDDFNQVIATGTVAYAAATAVSSTTPLRVDINVPKSTATSTQASASEYWGIKIPSSITYSGDYYGQNTFTAVVSDPIHW